ncbi:MAG: HIT family protein [Bacillota bacterium]|nr:HIT family protein [Bacillota bacterium]
MDDCPFCDTANLTIIAENELAIAFYDGTPISNGHSLVIPRRHVSTYFDASAEEHEAIHQLICSLKKYLDKKYNPDGYNIGANVGHYAGQTVFHFHIHVIPRYRGDVKDPKGGVRKVIPNRKSRPKSRKKPLH